MLTCTFPCHAILRQPKGFGTSSRNVANADPEGDVSNTEALLQTLGEVSQSSGREALRSFELAEIPNDADIYTGPESRV